MKMLSKNKTPKTPMLSDRGLNPIRHASDDVMAQLKGYRASVTERLSATEFAYALIQTEIQEWDGMKQRAADKLTYANSNNRAAIERLLDIAKITLERYQKREPELKAIIDGLDATLKRINAAISVLEVDQNLRSVSGMFATDGLGQLDFDMKTEADEIRRLCYTADAFLELEA